MSDTKNTGGPAFPTTFQHVTDTGIWPETINGMTLRDYFASRLMPEVYRQYADQANAKNKWDADWQMHLSVDAYRLADAMLQAREL